ncbi:GIY-YIG nuclease family protein [Escherichia coli]|uniref:GIY-YIG nuclease family protein n=1 Tax=Escherichia coli TaxID=562 RepID=UPI000DA4E5A9|nr:GIY-YIG nuclease family protein [Escherichia coli]SQP32696.1 Protein of uncharacterised function (DUF723) [Escherichia coli]SQR23053.1 Protein of uncharacterised function (DUF723) [Escherichia coli]HAN7646864.1 hypothetical protein [Escherichia coli]
MEIRFAADIEWIRRSAVAKSPFEWESSVVGELSKNGFVYKGFVMPFVGKKTKIAAECLEHGMWYSTSAEHVMSGQGCPKCKAVKISKSRRKPEDVALQQAKDEATKRGDCEVIGFDGGYKTSNTKNLIVRCFVHGEYKTRLTDFITGYGCIRCYHETIGDRCKKPEDVALQQAKDEATKRGDCEVIGFDGGYRGANVTNLIIRCFVHGTYKVRLSNFLHGRGCKKCAAEKSSIAQRKSNETALQQAKDEATKRGDCGVIGFDGGYKNYSTKNLIIRCFVHGEYKISLANFLKGVGCASCMECGYQSKKYGYVYVQKIEGAVNAIKFGITNRDPFVRMKEHDKKSKMTHEMVFFWGSENGEHAQIIERTIKERFKDFTGAVPRELMKDGFTETLPIEILPNFLKDVKSLCNEVRHGLLS